MGAMASQITNLTIVYSSKLRVTGLCAGNSPVTGEFPALMASNAENVSIWWRNVSQQRNLRKFAITCIIRYYLTKICGGNKENNLIHI